MLLKINLLFYCNQGSVDDLNLYADNILTSEFMPDLPAAFLFFSFFLWQKKRDYVIREIITKFLFPGVGP